MKTYIVLYAFQLKSLDWSTTAGASSHVRQTEKPQTINKTIFTYRKSLRISL